MNDDFNLAEIYLTQNENKYFWQYSNQKSLPIDEEEQEIFGEDFRIEHQIVGEKKVIYMKWADTMPQKDTFKDDGIKKLQTALTKIADKSNLLVCFYDGTMPDWIVDNGGWLNSQTTDAFLQYIEYVLRNLAGKINYFLISDEQNLALYNSYLTKSNGIVDKKTLEQALDNFIITHIKAYHKIQEINLNYDVDGEVGVALHFRMFDTTKLLTKLKESEQESLLQDDIFTALATGELPRNADKFLYGQQRFFDFLCIKTFSLSDNANKLVNSKNIIEDSNWSKCKTLFCKMLLKYFNFEDAQVYILK